MERYHGRCCCHGIPKLNSIAGYPVEEIIHGDRRGNPHWSPAARWWIMQFVPAGSSAAASTVLTRGEVGGGGISSYR